MEAIFNRRSIRKYTDDPVRDTDLRELLAAAMSAPSAGNEQPWHFVVIRDRKIIDNIPDVHPHSKMVRLAPVVILVCCDMNLVKHEGFWVQDCAAAIENLLIAVADKGLGAVWLGVYPREDRVKGCRTLFDLPEHIVPVAFVPVGHPDERKDPEDRYRPERVHRDKWGGS